MFQSAPVSAPWQDQLTAGGVTAALLLGLALALCLAPAPPAAPSPAEGDRLVEFVTPPPAAGGGGSPVASRPPTPPPKARQPLPDRPVESNTAVPTEPAVPVAVPAPTEANAAEAEDDGLASGPDGAGNGRGAGSGIGPGAGDGPPGTDLHVHLSYAAVKVKRQVTPVYPRAAQSLGLPETRCKARVDIDTRGRPTQVQVGGCAAVFHAATVDALMRWRFYPARRDGRAVPATFVVPLRYR